MAFITEFQCYSLDKFAHKIILAVNSIRSIKQSEDKSAVKKPTNSRQSQRYHQSFKTYHIINTLNIYANHTDSKKYLLSITVQIFTAAFSLSW